MKHIKIDSVYKRNNNSIDAFPRKAKLHNCIIISLYGSFFFSFLCPWFDSKSSNLSLFIDIIFILCFISLFFMLYKRQNIYNFYCKLLKRKVLLFEFGYFCTISIVYGILVTIIPIIAGMINHGDLKNVLNDINLTRYIIFSGGAAGCTGAIAGFDTYPVNNFISVKSIERLIDITKSLLKTSNRILITITGAIVIGNVISHRDIKIYELYISLYGIIGVAFGVSGVLGSRLAELLYILSMRETSETLKSVSPQNSISQESETLY